MEGVLKDIHFIAKNTVYYYLFIIYKTYLIFIYRAKCKSRFKERIQNMKWIKRSILETQYKKIQLKKNHKMVIFL